MRPSCWPPLLIHILLQTLSEIDRNNLKIQDQSTWHTLVRVASLLMMLPLFLSVLQMGIHFWVSFYYLLYFSLIIACQKPEGQANVTLWVLLSIVEVGHSCNDILHVFPVTWPSASLNWQNVHTQFQLLFSQPSAPGEMHSWFICWFQCCIHCLLVYLASPLTSIFLYLFIFNYLLPC